MIPNTKPLRAALAAVSVLLAAALVAAVYFGFGWGRAFFVDKSAAELREDALGGARQSAVNLSTYDSADLEKSFATIESSITGDAMLNDLNATKQQIGEQLAKSRAKTEATVVDGALTEFDRDGGTATALLVLASKTTWPDQPARNLKLTVRVTVEDVDGIWKASKMENIGSPIAMDPAVPEQEPVPSPESQEPAPPAEQPGG